MKNLILILMILVSPLISEEINKIQIPYLMQSGDFDKSLTLYEQYKAQIGRHDFELLGQACQIILEQGAKSDDSEKQLLSIYGAGIAGITSCIDLLENTITASALQIQMASIQILSQMQDDRADELLTKAMSSDHFGVRMEAAYQLSVRKHIKAVGYIESLMHRLPPQLRFFFPQFFALIGTKEAVNILKLMMNDKEVQTRIEAVLNAARFGRDDLLPTIRANVTHVNIPEQESCAFALGALKDSKSIPKLKTLIKSPNTNVKLAALRSLHMLGDTAIDQEIIEMAKAKDLFAIAILGDINNSEEVLAELSKSEDLQVKYNAAIALLQKKDNRCIEPILEILIRDVRDLGFFPNPSHGKSLTAWKVITSARQHIKEYPYDLYAVSLALREHLLKQCLELKEKEFLLIADLVFESKQTSLIPLLVRLLENLQTPEAKNLLQHKAQKAGAPLIRAYSNLAAFRLNMGGGHEKTLKQWIQDQKNNEMIRFRPALPFDIRLPDTSFELTPEESSLLLIESYEALAARHEEGCIDILLKTLKEGNPKNRCVIAGLILKSIE